MISRRIASECIRLNACDHASRTPTLGTLLEEVAELARSLEGKHEHHPALELVQIGGIVVNMLCQYEHGEIDAAIEARYGDEH